VSAQQSTGAPSSSENLAGSKRRESTCRAARDEIERLQERGLTVSGVVRDGVLVGLLGIGDELKADATETVQRITDAGIAPVMITGDNERTAQAVADDVGIDRVMADVPPDEKREEIGRLQDDGHRVAMVGDGIITTHPPSRRPTSASPSAQARTSPSNRPTSC